MTTALSRRAVPAEPARPRQGRSRRGPGRCAAALLVAVAGMAAACSPPPSAEEPTGKAAEQAWTIMVGEHRLDRTVAHAYSLALNSRETPTVVESREASAADLVAPLNTEEMAGGTAEAESADQPADESGADAGSGHQMSVARTMPLAEQLDPDGYAELTEPRSEAAAPPEELTELIAPQLDAAEMLDPASATFAAAVVTTSVTAEQHEIDRSAEADDPAFAAACDELDIGVPRQMTDVELPLAELYDCEPAAVTVGSEDELIDQVVRAELDAAIISASHPGITDHALIALADAEQAFPQQQYVPVVSHRVSDQVPEVVDEVAAGLDDGALHTLRRLIDGDRGLEPSEAAEYWLVEEEIVAEPADWG